MYRYCCGVLQAHEELVGDGVVVESQQVLRPEGKRRRQLGGKTANVAVGLVRYTIDYLYELEHRRGDVPAFALCVMTMIYMLTVAKATPPCSQARLRPHSYKL